MTTHRASTLFLAAALLAAPVRQGALADDPWPEPRPIARETPAFHAPAEPPDPETVELAVTEPAGPLAQDDALALALLGNPDLAAFSFEVRAGEARAIQAGTIRNPEVDYRFTRLNNLEPDPDESRHRVIVSQELELGGKRSRRVELADSERSLAGWDYEAKRVEVATELAARFAAVLGAQLRVAALARAEEYFEKTRERVLALVGTGALGTVESHRVARRSGLARIERQDAESELETARFALAALWGSTSPRFTEALGDLATVEPLPPIEAVLQIAEQGPALARWDAEIAREEAAFALARSGKVPDLTLGGGFRWQDDFSERDYLVDLQVTLPIFDRQQGDAREAQHGMARARAGRRSAAAESSAAIAEAYYRLTACETRVKTLRDEVIPAASATLQAVELGLERSAADLDDVLDAREDLAEAEADHAEALVDYRQSLAALEGLVGQSLAVSSASK